MITGIDTTPLFNENSNCVVVTFVFSSERLLHLQPSEYHDGLSSVAEVLTALARIAQHGNVKEEVGSIPGLGRSLGGKSWLKTQHSKNEDHSIRSHHFIWNRWGNSGNSDRLYLGGSSKITADGDCSQEIKRGLLLGRKIMTNLDSIFRKGNGTPLQYSCLENPMDRGAW